MFLPFHARHSPQTCLSPPPSSQKCHSPIQTTFSFWAIVPWFRGTALLGLRQNLWLLAAYHPQPQFSLLPGAWSVSHLSLQVQLMSPKTLFGPWLQSSMNNLSPALLRVPGLEFWILHCLCNLAHTCLSFPGPWFLSLSSEDPSADLQPLLCKWARFLLCPGRTGCHRQMEFSPPQLKINNYALDNIVIHEQCLWDSIGYEWLRNMSKDVPPLSNHENIKYNIKETPRYRLGIAKH